METIQQMRERRNVLAKAVRNVLDNNKGASWNDEHQKTYDENMEQIAQIDASIERETRLLDVEADRRFGDMGAREVESPANAVNQIYAKWLRGGDRSLTIEDHLVVQAAMSGDQANGAQGGYTVPTTVAEKLLEAQKAFGGMRNVATILRTASGNPISYPTTDGTGEEGELVPENTSATDQDITFGTRPLNVYKFSSKVVTVPWELLQDSAIDVEALVRRRLEMRLARVTNRLFTVGTGVGQPGGISTRAVVGKIGAVAAVPLITYDDLVDLEHSVDPAYRSQASWMFSDLVLASVRKQKDGQGRPIYAPAYEAPGGAPATLLNRRYEINQHMPAPAAGAKSVVFGDLSNYVIRDVMDVTLFRFTDSAYTKKGQVGFLAWQRSGGDLMDLGDAVKAFQNGAAA